MAEDDLEERFDWGKLGPGRVLHNKTLAERVAVHGRAWGPCLVFTALWVGGLVLVGGTLGGPYVSVSALIFFYSCTARTRTSALSAYSVFNPNFERGLGQISSADWDRQFRGGLASTPLAERTDETPLFGEGRPLMEGSGQRVGTSGSGGGGENALLAQLAREREARRAAAAAAAKSGAAASAPVKRD